LKHSVEVYCPFCLRRFQVVVDAENPAEAKKKVVGLELTCPQGHVFKAEEYNVIVAYPIREEAVKVEIEKPTIARPVEIVRAERLPNGDVVVTIKVKRRKRVGDRMVEWEETQTFTHPASDVQRFIDLLNRLKRERKLSIVDGVLAYFIVFTYGRKSVIAGFLWALRDIFPEFQKTVERVPEKVTYKTLRGYEEKTIIKETRKKVSDPNELTGTVVEAISRLVREGIISRVKLKEEKS